MNRREAQEQQIINGHIANYEVLNCSHKVRNDKFYV